MDKELRDQWKHSMEMLMQLSESKRKHFAMLLMSLADCYDDENDAAAVVLLSTEDGLVMFSAGATEFECSEMLSKANELVHAVATADAPEKGMFN
jgi:hypothetical protein